MRESKEEVKLLADQDAKKSPIQKTCEIITKSKKYMYASNYKYEILFVFLICKEHDLIKFNMKKIVLILRNNSNSAPKLRKLGEEFICLFMEIHKDNISLYFKTLQTSFLYQSCYNLQELPLSFNYL